MDVLLLLKTGEGAETLLGEMSFSSIEQAYLDVCEAIPEAVVDYLRQRCDPFGYSYVLTNAEGEVLLEVPFAEALNLSNVPAPRRDAPDRRPGALVRETERLRRLCAQSRVQRARARAALRTSRMLLQRTRVVSEALLGRYGEYAR